MQDNSEAIQSFYDKYGEQLRLTSDYEHLEPVLPAIENKRVLDAGCSLGDGSQYLADKGADVVGIDISQAHVNIARNQYGDAVTFHRMDLAEPLDTFENDSFNLVVSALTLTHIEDWDSVFGEFSRIIKKDGCVVVYLDHPFVDYLELKNDTTPMVTGAPANYTNIEQFTRPWGPDEAAMPLVRRPLGECLRPALEAGFVLETFLEPGTEAQETNCSESTNLPRHLLARFRTA
jgi:Methylase involved in ubiquinone/menaquinone biosynthesis